MMVLLWVPHEMCSQAHNAEQDEKVFGGITRKLEEAGVDLLRKVKVIDLVITQCYYSHSSINR